MRQVRLQVYDEVLKNETKNYKEAKSRMKMASKVKRQAKNEAIIIELEKEESLWNVRNHLCVTLTENNIS